jgi:hypothetical protein
VITVRCMRELRALSDPAKGQWVDHACMTVKRRDGTQEVIHSEIPEIPFTFLLAECFGGHGNAYGRADRDGKRRLLQAEGSRTPDEIERILDQ